MPDIKIYIESTYKGPSKTAGVGMYLIEWVKDGIPITREGFVHQEEGTEAQICLKAMINAFHILKKPCQTLINTQSRTIFNTINNGWLEGWQQSGFTNAKGEEVKNKDLWLMFLEKTTIHSYSISTGHHEYKNVMQSELNQEFERWRNEQINNTKQNK